MQAVRDEVAETQQLVARLHSPLVAKLSEISMMK